MYILRLPSNTGRRSYKKVQNLTFVCLKNNYLEDLISEVFDHVFDDSPVHATRAFVRSNVDIVVVKIAVGNVDFEVVRF